MKIRNFNYLTFLSVVFFSCQPSIDHYGNKIDLNKDKILLKDVKEDSLINNIFHFTFILKRGSPQIEINNFQIKRYIKLVKNYFGYDDIIILKYRQRGIIQPRFYISIKYE
tara:strand:- start:138 stop:470 length:333 start_codon:yes stop_codon:yes gene_type:complete